MTFLVKKLLTSFRFQYQGLCYFSLRLNYNRHSSHLPLVHSFNSVLDISDTQSPWNTTDLYGLSKTYPKLGLIIPRSYRHTGRVV